jgi:hypothetical protein
MLSKHCYPNHTEIGGSPGKRVRIPLAEKWGNTHTKKIIIIK